MARLSSLPKNTLQRDLPEKDKLQLALQFLRQNPNEKPITAARLYNIKNEGTVQRTWLRERKGLGKKKRGGQNKILRPDQHQALIKYAADQATGGGKGATKQMMYNCAMWFRVEEKKSIPSWRWFQLWLRDTPELHTIKTKPIASHRVDMHTEKSLRDWFEKEYKPALEFTGIRTGKRIHNMDEKGARVAVPAGEEVVVPIGIKEMYVGVPENRLSLTVVESISADGKSIPPLIIVPGILIMETWFHEKMTGHELVTVSSTGYTNEGICMTWLEHFIKHNDCGLDKEWHILLIDGATCHEANQFIITAKMNKIWVVKYPSHQTHLIQPLDVGCFRQWKHYQQVALMNAIRSFEAEYLVSSFLRDLPTIREKTFTVSTIKHSFQNSGIWPVSFKAVKKKLKEYGKKSKKDTGLDSLEYGSESESEAEDGEPKPVLDPTLTEEYQLPRLKLPSSYDECRRLNEKLAPKIRAAVSSPTRKEFDISRESTNTWLMRGSLGEMEIMQAQAAAVERHKKRLISRRSLAKGGSLLASDALQKMIEKRRKEADEVLRKANTALTRAQNKQTEELRQEGVADRSAERERKQYLQQHQALGSTIPPYMWTPIRDRQKEPTTAEIENRQIALQSLREAVGKAERDREEVYTTNPTSLTSIPIDPAILQEEREFQLSQRGGLQVTISVDDSAEEGGDNSGGESEGDYQRSVATIDSIAENVDFVSFE
jgi:hypothetical protein